MPKVSYSESKGLVQESGKGFDVKLGDSSDAHDLTVEIGQATTGVVTLQAATNNQDVSISSIPAGAIVLGGKIEILTADTNSNGGNIVSVGTTGDPDKFGDDGDSMGDETERVLIPKVLIPETSAITTIRALSSANPAGATRGTFRVTLNYISVS